MSLSKRVDFVIAGAGVVAIATARYLAKSVPNSSIILITPHAPMSQTSSLSTECFRNHWPSQAMRSFMTRSINLINEQAENGSFRVIRGGYLFCSNEQGASDKYMKEAIACHGTNVRTISTPAEAKAIGCAPFTFSSPLNTGAEVYTSTRASLEAFPYLSPTTVSVMHARNAGWISAQTMGMDMLETLKERKNPINGQSLTSVIKGKFISADLGKNNDKIKAVMIQQEGKDEIQRIECGAFINATGPFLKSTHKALLGNVGEKNDSELPVFSEVHSKVIFRDVYGLVPRDAPQVILTDAVSPIWHPEELEHLSETSGKTIADRASSIMAGGAHFRPYGGENSDAMLLLWESWHHGIEPAEPPPDSADCYLDHQLYPDIALRGLARVVPSLAAYFDETVFEKRIKKGKSDIPSMKPPVVDGGYYTKTIENLPMIGPAPGINGKGFIENAYICGAVSGYGIMASHAAGELCAAHVTGNSDITRGKDITRTSPFIDYKDLMTPLRHQQVDFIKKGGIRDQLLAAGGGQL
jgi:sarcosine oxidase, subunit beta